MTRHLPDENRPFPSRTRIIATLGPATDDAEVLGRVVDAGARIFRLNFSHGGVEEHRRRIKAVRQLEQELGTPLAIMGDLPGPKIRVIQVPDGGIEVSPGEDVLFERSIDGSCEPAAGDRPVRLSCTWQGMVDCVHPGQRVLINDGAIRLLATEVMDDSLLCRVTAGGLITSHKGVNLPDSELDIEVPTDRDQEMACWAIDHDVDLIAMSFVRAGEEVESLREVMRSHMGADCVDRPLPIVAKIEVPQGVQKAEEIIAAADAVMVARGDLGVEMDLARVPIIQKRLLSLARALDRPCIVATQMLQSMIESPIPTRAEASDVAGAIFDGADAVMLSGETAVGAYPVVAVETMRRIGDEMENWMQAEGLSLDQSISLQLESHAQDDSQTLVAGIWSTAEASQARCIVVYSEWGTWSRLISRSTRPIPILAYTRRQKVVRQMLLCRGVTPELMEVIPDEAVLTRDVQQRLHHAGWLEAGDAVLVVMGRPLESSINSTRMTVHRLVEGPELT